MKRQINKDFMLLRVHKGPMVLGEKIPRLEMVIRMIK